MTERDNRIRAAGVVQAVINSGAPAEEWISRALYGMRVVNYVTARLNNKKPEPPKVPASIRSEDDGSE